MINIPKFIAIFRSFTSIAIAAVLIATLSPAAEAMAKDPTAGFFDPLQKRLIADGFDAKRIHNIYQDKDVAFEAKGVTAYFRHNEATLDYDKFTKPNWIREAKAYMKTHADALSQAEKKYGVDPKIITAIMLVETKFGSYVGRRSILNTLSTMAALDDPGPREYLLTQLNKKKHVTREEYEKKAASKSGWAYKELKAFLSYTEQHNMDAVSLVGSYAGAMGIAQFMPSNVLAYGQDGNGDGRINLYEDADAIYSIAAYLKNYGWKPGIDRDQASKVVYHYNHSQYYVNAVLKIADLLEG